MSQTGVGGNAILLDYYNANIIHCPIENAHDFIDAYQEELDNAGIKYVWIPEGGHIPQASFGYVDAAREIQNQSAAVNVNIDAVFLPCGTGTTQAGLIYGFEDCGVDIIGVSIARPAERCRKVILRTLADMRKLMGLQQICDYKVNVIHDYSLQYGEVNHEIRKSIKALASADGIFLDPVYNAKAFWGMEEYLKNKQQYENVLYINTGGAPNIFSTSAMA